MIDRIRLRRDTSSDWSFYNPVLSSGEPGVELDTNRIKVGNGVTDWNNLPYILGNVSGLELLIGDGSFTSIQWDISERLNFRGSGDTSVLFNDGTNTITIYSSGTLPELQNQDIIDALGYTPQISGSYASSVHTHAISDVSGLNIALSGKQPSGNYADLIHYHQLGDVSGLIGALNNKQPLGSYAAADHSHTLYISNGVNNVISYSISDPLKFIGSGIVSLSFNDTTNTIIIGSSGGGAGGVPSFANVDLEEILFKNTAGDIAGNAAFKYDETNQLLKTNNFVASGDITGIIDGGNI
jgi:hypothetical protein